jgi:single-strand DNA-binding protein
VVLNIATQESWKNDKGDYETRTEWHRVFAWRSLSKFAKMLKKGQLITLETSPGNTPVSHGNA